MSETKIKPPQASLPFSPLWNKAAAMAGANGPVGPVFSSLDFASRVGHNVKAVNRWKENGEIPWLSADRAAIAMGVHPMAVWGYDWLEVKGDYDKIESGAMDATLNKALESAEEKGVWTDEDGKIHGRGWTIVALVRARELEASVMEEIEDDSMDWSGGGTWPEDVDEATVAHDIGKWAEEAGLIGDGDPEFASLEDAGLIE